MADTTTPLRARRSFSVGSRIIARGRIVAADDPIVAGRGHLFEPVDARLEREVERATAQPGERRHVTPAAGDEIPTKVGAIVEWIGDDAERAQKALDLEQAKAKPRPGVITAAQAVLDAPPAPSDGDQGNTGDAGDADSITVPGDPTGGA
ncbi:MAG: hypothetical protein ACXIVQ_12230 [Acidimicrobiales bacterium]